MEKKIFVKKGQKAGGVRSYLKLLMWSAGALIILILLIPLGMRKKGEVDFTAKQSPEKGMVMREIPKSPSLPPQEEQKSDGIPGFIPFDKSPEAEDAQAAGKILPGQAKPSETQSVAGGPKAPEDVPQKGGPEKALLPENAPSSPPQDGKTALLKESAPIGEKGQDAGRKVLKEGATAKDKAEPDAGSKTPAQKAAKTQMQAAVAPAPSEPTAAGASKRLMYAVQVGSFKEKSNAEEMQRNLEKKGYTVQVKPRNDPKLGSLYVVQLAPVPDLSKASTLVEQIRREDKVKPFVVKISPGE